MEINESVKQACILKHLCQSAGLNVVSVDSVLFLCIGLLVHLAISCTINVLSEGTHMLCILYQQ